MARIEKGVPLPEGNEANYPFNDMEVGDTFFVPGDDKYTYLRVRATKLKQKTGKQWTVRRRRKEEHGEEGIRVWRIA